MLLTILLAALAVVLIVAGYFAQDAFAELMRRWFPGWQKKWAGRTFLIAMVVMGAVAALGAFLAARGNGGISPTEYTEKLNLIVCELDESGREAAAAVELAWQDFWDDPNEHTKTFIGEAAKFSDGEFSRVDRAIDDLNALLDRRPPSEFIADHKTYTGHLGAYKAVVREIDDRVPEDADQLSNRRLIEILLTEDEDGVAFDGVVRRVVAALKAARQADYGEEFEDMISCELIPPPPPPTPTTAITPTMTPTSTATPLPPPTATAGPAPSTATPGPQPTTATPVPPPTTATPGPPPPTPTPTPVPPPTLDRFSGRWQYDGEADYFLVELSDNAAVYTYQEICAPTGRVKGTGTATVRGTRVSMIGFDDISTYELEMEASADWTRLSGIRTRPPSTGFPPFEIVLVKGTHTWTKTACDLFPEGIP